METLLNLYLVFSTVLFSFLFLIWNGKNWANLFLKFTMLILSVGGIVLSLNAFGFIVKV